MKTEKSESTKLGSPQPFCDNSECVAHSGAHTAHFLCSASYFPLAVYQKQLVWLTSEKGAHEQALQQELLSTPLLHSEVSKNREPAFLYNPPFSWVPFSLATAISSGCNKLNMKRKETVLLGWGGTCLPSPPFKTMELLAGVWCRAISTIQEVERWGSGVQGHHQLHRKFKTILGHERFLSQNPKQQF